MESKPPTKPKGEKKKKSKSSGKTVTPPPVEQNVQKASHIEVPKIANPVVAEMKVPQTHEKEAKKKSSKSTRRQAEAPVPVSAPVPDPAPAPIVKPKLKKLPSNTIHLETPIVRDVGNAETVDDEDDGYGDDDFDDYSDDEFEPYETTSAPKPVARSLAGVKRVSDNNDGEVVAGADLREMQMAMKAENDAAINRRNEKIAHDKAEAKAGPGPKKESKQSKSEARRSASKPMARKYLHLGADLTVKSLKADDPRVLRARMIKQQVKFNQEKFVSFDQSSPLSEYDLYMRKLHNLKRGNISQKANQSNEDDRSIETQTEEIEVQHQESQFQCGDDDTSFYNLLSSMEEARSGGGSKEDMKECLSQISEDLKAQQTKSHHQPGSLAKFLRSTSKVMEELLVEISLDKVPLPDTHSQSSGSSLFQPQSWVSLSIPGAKHFTRCMFNGSSLMSVSTLAVTDSSRPLTSVVCLWDATTHNLLHLLLCECKVTSVCLVPHATHLVMAGSAEGNVLVWDLRQEFSSHALELGESLQLGATPRFPTLCTHHTPEATKLHHTSPVLNVLSLAVQTLDGQSCAFDGSLSFASVDDRGLICFWLLSEADESDMSVNTTNPIDSKLRLVCSRTLVLKSLYGKHNEDKVDKLSFDDLLLKQSPGPSISGVAFYPWNTNHFLSYHQDGQLIHESRFGNNGNGGNTPRNFMLSMNLDMFDHNQLLKPKVTCIDFSCFYSKIFLVGYEDGSLALFHASSSNPRTCWDSHCFIDHDPSSSSSSSNSRKMSNQNSYLKLDLSRSIVQIKWSLHRPTVFYVLDSVSCLHVFDLMKDEDYPIMSERITELDQEGEEKGIEEKSDLCSSSSAVSSASSLSLSLSHYASSQSLLAVTVNGTLKVRPLASSLILPIANEISIGQSLLDSLL